MTGDSTLIRNGLIYDGSGAPPYPGDLRLHSGRITQISRSSLKPKYNETTVDAKGCWITPGFIDIHTHYDAEIEVMDTDGNERIKLENIYTGDGVNPRNL